MKNSLNILYISDRYPPYVKGGAEVSTSLLIDWLTSHSLAAITVACGRYATGPWLQNGVMVYPIIHWATVGDRGVGSAVKFALGLVVLPLVSAFSILRLIRRIRPDVVQIVPSSHQFIPIILATRYIARLPVVVDCRDYSLVCPTQLSSEKFEDAQSKSHGYRCLLAYTPKYPALRILAYPFAFYESFVFNTYKYLLRMAIDHDAGIRLVALSEYVKGQLITNGFNQEHITVIYNMAPEVPTEHITVCEGVPKFVYAGRLEIAKGIWDLLLAIEILRQKGYEFIVNIVGNGGASSDVRRYVEEHGLTNVTMVGQVNPERVLALYAQATAVVAPVRWPEPFGRFILEAIAVGVPVIATNVGGIPEGVDHDKTGILIRNKNPEQLAQAMERFILDPGLALRMRPAIQEKRAQYGAEHIAKLRMALYNHMTEYGLG